MLPPCDASDPSPSQLPQLAEDKAVAMAREHKEELAALQRLHQSERDRDRDNLNTRLTARDRQHEERLEESKALHRAQLEAYHRIDQHGGKLHDLAQERRTRRDRTRSRSTAQARADQAPAPAQARADQAPAPAQARADQARTGPSPR
eukprot:4868127-Prymnesium_polylepis.1